MSDSTITIEITYALPTKQTLISLTVVKGSTVQSAIDQSGLLQKYSDIDLTINRVGIWYKTTKLDTILKQGDRIEIYRPLIADPKEVRKLRAAKAKEEGRANRITGAKV